nr:SLC13 family permease [Kibdelosporangium sp. MJ126-NF4]CEL21798.1 Arsenic efflux pump protein [Kibdelosporangium sp. MJ126-NF4]CTQ92578.1 Arsenic efflux pump protein [Kibdelosporangium sp. MJ126-NF4]
MPTSERRSAAPANEGEAAQPPEDPPTAGERSQRTRWRTPRLHILDWIALGLLLVGALCVLSGALPVADARASIVRLVPLLLFLGSVIILAELTAAAEVFDVIATRLSIIGRGHYPLLFLLCVTLAAATTITLNLDTTAVLLTPVILALATALGIPPLPLAMTTVWLSNTASLLLPVSNLTNLLAADRVALSPSRFAAQMWAPQLAAILVTAGCLWIWYWRRGQRGGQLKYELPQRRVPADRPLFVVAAVACLVFVVGILVGVPIGIASAVSAGVLVVAFFVRKRSQLRFGLIPWRLLVFVIGLFLVIDTLGRHGLGSLIQSVVGADDGALGAARAAGAGAGLSNLVNNLPAYVAGEAIIPPDNHIQLLALLIGTNVGPVITPWASLATLLWYERCHAVGVKVPLGRFMWTGAILAVTALAASVGVLLVVG